jgi:diadenosine tetraphosphate (Ap4A) HIT family hydrolase
MTTSFCQACSREWPRSDHFLADCGHTRAYLHEDQFFPGWTVLVLKRHATELFYLSIEERAGMIEEVARMAEVLAREYRTIKINYEVLGNQVPHIHWHVIPRPKDDPAPLDPVWTVVHTPRRLEDDELAEVVARLRIQVRRS